MIAFGEYILGIALLLASAFALLSKLWHKEKGIFIRTVVASCVLIGLLICVMISLDALDDHPVSRLPHAWKRFVLRKHDQVTAAVSSQIVARVLWRWYDPKPPLYISETHKIVQMELFNDWTLTLESDCDASDFTLDVTHPLLKNDRIRVTPNEAATVSEIQPRWFSGIDEPSRDPDYYGRTIKASLRRGRKVTILFRRSMVMQVNHPFTFTPDYFYRKVSISEPDNCHVTVNYPYDYSEYLRIMDQIYNLDQYLKVPVVIDPDVKDSPLQPDEHRMTCDVSCKDRECKQEVTDNCGIIK